MTLPYASMKDVSEESKGPKPTATALWRKWRPGNMVPSLKPRLNRRRRRSSTAFPTTANSPRPAAARQPEEEEDLPTSPPQQDDDEPSSPPTSSHVEPEQEQCTTPRTEERMTFDSTFSLTPPTASPAPLVVSAKRLGSEVRRNHSKRRKGRMWDDKENASSFNVSSWRAGNEQDDEKEEGLPPVEHLSPEERTQRYWKWCYGDSTEPMPPQSSWSATRAPPGKSCLSSRKEPMVRAVTLETPTLDRLSTDNPSTAELPIQPNAFETPSNTPPDAVIKKSTCSKSVQFGMASAAEYELDRPPKELTPMPSEVAKERFPLTEPVQDDQEATEETKHNSATLAQWDNDFDSYLSSDDDDESSSGEELESMLFSRKRKNRRNSGFFSPDTASLLLPEDNTEETSQDCDLSTDVNMASLAVRSPMDMEGKTVQVTGIPSKRLELSPQSSSMDTTPPSEIQLGTVNSTGGALAEANRRDGATLIPSRQLHGALERCAEDENDIVIMLMQNPNLEMEWPTEKLLRTMARHSVVYVSPSGSAESERRDMLEFLSSIECLLPISSIRKHLLNEIERGMSEIPQAPCVSLPPDSSDEATALTVWEVEKCELRSFESLLEQLRELDVCAKREVVEMEKLCMLQRLVMKRPAEEEDRQVAQLEQLVRAERAERDLAVARLRYQEALRDLERAAPYNVVQCLALNNTASFALESVSPSRVDMSFSCAAEGPRPCLRWDAKEGIGSFVMPESSPVAERAPKIPADHVAASFYRELLFVDGNDGFDISPAVLQHVLSNDVSQTVLSLSLLMGRLDLVLADLMRVTTKSYIGNVSVEREGESLLLLSISFLDDLHVHFYYDCHSERSLAHSIPSRVRVIHAGIRMESLEAEALQTIRSGTAPCLERICDAFFLASCV